MTIQEAIAQYTSEDFAKSYATLLFSKGKLLIDSTPFYEENKTYNINDVVLYNDAETHYLIKKFKSLIDDNNNKPTTEQWEEQGLDYSHTIFFNEIDNILSLIKISLNNKSIIYPCLLNQTILNEEDLKAYVSYILNLYIAMMLYNQKNKIIYRVSNSQSLDGASFSASVPPALQDLNYFAYVNNPFAMELLDFIMKNCYLQFQTINNTQEDYWLSDV